MFISLNCGHTELLLTLLLMLQGLSHLLFALLGNSLPSEFACFAPSLLFKFLSDVVQTERLSLTILSEIDSTLTLALSFLMLSCFKFFFVVP
jgi:hypothetical protein